jgi:predicted acylesterase/phospholipase RssA
MTSAPLAGSSSDVSLAVTGGGTNVIALAAALYAIVRRLSQERRQVRALVGSSAGGLSVLGAAFGVDEERLQAQLEGACSRNRLIDGGPHNLVMFGAWASMVEFRRNASLVLGGDARLGDARTPVACMVSDQWTGRPRIVSSWEHPGASAVDLACATAAIPYVFERQKIRGLDDHHYVDGGVAKNLASDELDRFGCPVVSLRLQSPARLPAEPRGPLGRLLANAELLMHASNNAWESDHADSIIVDVPGENGLDFDLLREDCVRRRRAGQLAGEGCRLPPPGQPATR